MNTRERLFGDIQAICKDAGLDFQKVSAELSEFIGSDEVIDYYISQGALPNFPDTIFDTFIVGEKCLYDYDRRQKGGLLHAQPLSRIVEVAEGFAEDDFLSVHFRIGELGSGLVLQDKVSKSENIRRFSRVVISKILENLG